MAGKDSAEEIPCAPDDKREMGLDLSRLSPANRINRCCRGSPCHCETVTDVTVVAIRFSPWPRWFCGMCKSKTAAGRCGLPHQRARWFVMTGGSLVASCFTALVVPRRGARIPPPVEPAYECAGDHVANRIKEHRGNAQPQIQGDCRTRPVPTRTEGCRGRLPCWPFSLESKNRFSFGHPEREMGLETGRLPTANRINRCCKGSPPCHCETVTDVTVVAIRFSPWPRWICGMYKSKLAAGRRGLPRQCEHCLAMTNPGCGG